MTTTKNTTTQVNKASTPASGVGRLGGLAERTTKVGRAYTKEEGATLEAGSPSSFSGYKELLTNSRNYLCKGKICRWAKCRKSIRFECAAYRWAVAEFERLRIDGGLPARDIEAPKDALSGYRGFGHEGANCGRWGMLKECERGHKILKRLVCGREWCPVCGQDNSEHHKRRIARLVDRVFSMDSVGYFVFEVPLAWRGYFEDAGMLRAASLYLSRMLGREGFPKAVRRWHYYGEAELKEGGLELGKYHPHLNCLCEGGYIGKKKLRRIRRMWSNWLKVNCNQKGVRTAPVYYQYARSADKKWHWVRYITRPTFKVLTDNNSHIASDLFSFNNTSWWGVFSDDDKARGRARFEVWLETLPECKKRAAVDVAAHDVYSSGLCPVVTGYDERGHAIRCLAKTAFVEGVVKSDDYEVIEDYGGGLYHVNSPPGGGGDGGFDTFLREADVDVLWGGGVANAA